MKAVASLFVLALSSTFVFAVAGCAASDEPADDPSVTGGDSEDDEIRATGVKVTDADEGKTIKVEEGQSVILMLPANATTGYEWKVTGTTRTLGYPKSRYLKPSSDGPVGAGGMARFTWKTKSPLPMTGKHAITLEYRRPWEDASKPAARKFTFTLEIVAAGQANIACVVGGCSGQRCVQQGGPGMITTCEWRAEYACYQRATCEVQADGKCGWTETPALTSCLAGGGQQ